MESTTSTNGVAANGHTEDHDKTTALTSAGALKDIDGQLKGGDWLTELERAEILATRESLYASVFPNSNDFIKDTSEKTGITRSVLQRVRRITRLPKEVMALLKGTKIADRQDLLVALSDRVVSMDLETALADTKNLIDNPPAYGPRSTPKTTPVDVPTTTATAMMGSPIDAQAALGIEVFEGLPISMAFQDREPRIQDLTLGRQLAYKSKYKIRELVAELVTHGHLDSSELLPAPGKSSTTAGRPGSERWFTEEQALFITSQAGTPVARALTRLVIRAFVAARRALSKPQMDLALAQHVESAVRPLFEQLFEANKRLAALERGGGFSTRPMLLVPQVDADEAGFSMESLNKALIEKGWNISETDTAIRSFAGKLKLIGDVTYGFWNAHSDRVNRSLSDSWRFNDAGAAAVGDHVLSYCKRKMQYEEEGQPAPRERALKEVLDLISPIGNGEHPLLTRFRTGKRQPFPALRGPND